MTKKLIELNHPKQNKELYKKIVTFYSDLLNEVATPEYKAKICEMVEELKSRNYHKSGGLLYKDLDKWYKENHNLIDLGNPMKGAIKALLTNK